MERTYTYDEVVEAANAAADMVCDELGLPDCGARDVANLVVNALGSRLRGTGISDLDDVIRDNYESDPADVRDWCSGVHGR